MAHYPIVKLPHEHMLIGSSSSAFQGNQGAFNEQVYYIGNDKCGWNGCDINVLVQIVREYTQPIDIDYGNCAIKNPIDLIPGDIITLCGTSTCKDAANGTQFAAALEYLDCNNVSEGGFQTAYAISNFKNFAFTDKFVCWSMTYKLPPGLYLEKCRFAFVVGLAAAIDAQIKVTWTLNIQRGGYDPPIPPFQ